MGFTNATTMLTTSQALQYFNSFFTLSKKAEVDLLQTIHEVKFQKGTIIIEQGQPSLFMYVIKKGIVRGYYYYNDVEITDSLWTEGAVFMDVMAYLTGQYALKSYETLEDSEFYCINIQKFKALFPFSPEISQLGILIAETFIKRIEQERDITQQLSSEAKYLRLLKTRPKILQRVPSFYVASYLNMQPETLSKIKGKMNMKVSVR